MTTPAEANIVLTGFMGTGKSTVGRLLAARLGYELVDTDELIVERHGPIADIFAGDGEERFRELEREVADELGKRRGLVVSTGGRLMLDPAASTSLSASGRVFCLAAEPEEILRRVLADADGPVRPLLAGPDPAQRILELLEERAEAYGAFEQVATDGRTPEAIADDIVRRFAGSGQTRPDS